MNVISHIICETTPIPFNFIDSMMKKATREGDGSAGAIFQFNTESWDIQVAVLVFTNTHKDVIPIGSCNGSVFSLFLSNLRLDYILSYHT